MEIIPVVDICRGRVVHALRGQRATYQPVQSGLCSGSDPEDIVQAFLDLYPFKKIYIADLDAITGMEINDKIINGFVMQFPDVCFWIDEGNSNIEDVVAVQRHNRIQVAGSETGISPEILNQMKNIVPPPVLSLDFRQGNFMGNMPLLLNPQCWPDHIIIMSLSRVGSGDGPDIELLNKITSIAKDKKFYLAGGIRNKDDLNVLKETGIAGVLIATALHNGDISGEDLRKFLDKTAQ